MTEYIIIVALVAIAAIGVYSFFGQATRQPPPAATPELPGKVATKELEGAQKGPGKSSERPGETKGTSDPKSVGAYK
jgi:hypothetical protein